MTQPKDNRRKILVTGAAGRIGSCFAAFAHERYDLRLMVRGNEPAIDAIRPYGEVVTCDVADLDGLKRACAGVDTVLHLAGIASGNALWRDLLAVNIIGTYHAFAAAKAAGCRRVLFASSIHAVSGYPKDHQVRTGDPVNPGDVYGVSKCFGEALARYMAEQERLSSIAIRIATFTRPPYVNSDGSVAPVDSFISDRDLNQLISCCIDTENIRFAIVHGVSNNRFKRLDLTDTREMLGYTPQDDFTQLHPDLAKLPLWSATKTFALGDPNRQSGLREDIG
jgi:nucleoside-diphosphate-sugar epimerase